MSLDEILRVEFCSHDAARFAVEHWHYSEILPTGKLVKVGAWERDQFVGAVIVSRGASPWLGNHYGLDNVEVAELTRVALRTHEAPVTAIVARALRLVRQVAPGVRLIVSFADPARGHHGGIYQAGGWVYTGRSNEVTEHLIDGRWRHTRGAYWRSKATNPPTRTMPGKFRYLMPMDKAMRRRVSRDALPYPSADDLPPMLDHADEGSTVSRPGSSG